MIEIYAVVNPISAVEQSHTREEIEARVAEVVRCFVALQPKFDSKTALLLFEATLEMASLGASEPLIASVNHLRDRQVARQWFWYTRNRARLVSSESIPARIVTSTSELEATLSRELVELATHWISFEGAPGFRCGEIRVHTDSTGNCFIRKNAENAETVARWLPRYEASPKHGPQEYLTTHGTVSAMELREEEASLVLAKSIRHSDHVRFGIWREAFFVFRLTRVDGEQPVFHGFNVDSGEIPGEAQSTLRVIERGR